MKKCKVADKSVCDKDICCFECEEKDSCDHKCGFQKSEGCDNLIDTDAMDETKAIEKFQEEKKNLITQIATFKKQMDEMENQKKELHEQLEKAMELYGVKSIVTGDIRITYTAAHTSKKFSTDAFKKDHADLYEAYRKESPVKASVKIEDLTKKKNA